MLDGAGGNTELCRIQVLLETTVGDIDIELWSKETPKACRNFVQLCMEGYYDGVIFHRVVRGFIAQGGDPTGTGQGGESIYGAPFRVGRRLPHLLLLPTGTLHTVLQTDGIFCLEIALAYPYCFGSLIISV